MRRRARPVLPFAPGLRSGHAAADRTAARPRARQWRSRRTQPRLGGGDGGPHAGLRTSGVDSAAQHRVLVLPGDLAVAHQPDPHVASIPPLRPGFTGPTTFPLAPPAPHAPPVL